MISIGFVVLHKLAPWRSLGPGVPLEDVEWEAVAVNVGTVFSISKHPTWEAGAIVYSTGTSYLEVRETVEEITGLREESL